MDNGDFIYADVAKENIGAVMSQYTRLVWDEKRKNNPNLEEIKRLENKHDKYATILFSFHEIPRDDYKSIAEKYGELFKDNKRKMKDNILL